MSNSSPTEILTHPAASLQGPCCLRWERFLQRLPGPAPSLAWLPILQRAMAHRPLLVEARRGEETVGLLPLAAMNSVCFGKFLISLPYLNSAGVRATEPAVAHAMIDEAVRLADTLNVRYLELRQECEWQHPRLRDRLTSKVHMRLDLPPTDAQLWTQLSSKVRNQIRKGERQGFSVRWGGAELLDAFYAVFSHNMRDLGTPVYGKGFFRCILQEFPSTAELCCLQAAGRTVSAALLLHQGQQTEVPSASSLRAFHSRNANMLLYWHLLQRAIERGSSRFDFGRSTRDSNTYRFKKQWGAQPSPAIWQYYLRQGRCDALRPESGRYALPIRIWQRLPLPLTRCLGPFLVRGIP
ncbi:MAG: FemAB family PEP-CTERM system-associated protein, partial [Planctomycetales bacterium]|nr:FemAB family PEP-CTERM system-associated protein [Planctomycetales bacterium]